MSFEQAAEALGGAIDADNGVTPSPAPTPAPEQATQPATTPEGTNAPQVQPHWSQQQPRDPSTGKFVQPDGTLSDTPAPVVDTFDGGQFNPDALPPELQPGWKQLQAAFTRSTQQLAEQRRQFEGIDPAVAREAVELYQSLQDPAYLTQFHSELSRALESEGLTPAQARTEAARMTEEAATSPSLNLSDQLASLRDDPELAPVANTLSALEQQNKSLEERLSQFEQAQNQREEAEQLAYAQMAMAGEIKRQEMAVLQGNPHYSTPETVGQGQYNDLDAIYALSAHFDGNLIQAQNAYEQMGQALLSRYLAQKQSVEQTPGVTSLPGSSGTSEIPTRPANMDEANVAALEYLRQAGIDTIG